MARRTNKEIEQDKYNSEVDFYKWYVIDITNKKAISGFEHKTDAIDLLNDYEGKNNYKVVAKKSLKLNGIVIPNEEWKYKEKPNMKPTVKKYFDVVYTTKSGKTMVAKRIAAATQKEAMAIVKKQMTASKTLKSVKLAIGLGNSQPKGMTKVIAKNIKITGLSKTTGRILKGYKYAKGGKIVKVKVKAVKK